MYLVVLGIQFTTHIKAIADGMVYNQLMNRHDKDFNKFMKKLREKSQKNKS